jgi:hypothetical protein
MSSFLINLYRRFSIPLMGETFSGEISKDSLFQCCYLRDSFVFSLILYDGCSFTHFCVFGIMVSMSESWWLTVILQKLHTHHDPKHKLSFFFSFLQFDFGSRVGFIGLCLMCIQMLRILQSLYYLQIIYI